jgi:hypothetical protein
MATPIKQFYMAGYSGTPLPQKLGIKPGITVVLINAPTNYRRLLGKAAETVVFSNRFGRNCGFIHFFTARRSELQERLKKLRSKISDTGILWVSWPKKSAGVPTDVTEDVIRAVALPLGFVDVKVCAVDEIWSGLKLMIRRTERSKRPSPGASRTASDPDSQDTRGLCPPLPQGED